MSNKRSVEYEQDEITPRKCRKVVKPNVAHSTLLDVLPTDVVERIVQHLNLKSYDTSAHNFAKLNVTMKTLVSNVLPSKYEINKLSKLPLADMWPLSEMPHLEELAVADETPSVLFCLVMKVTTPHTLTLPRQCEEYFNQGSMACVHELHVRVMKRTRAAIFAGLKGMRLVRLKLTCGARYASSCLFNERNPRSSRSVASSLARSCPNLPSLEVVCRCRGRYHAAWMVFTKLSRLREFSVDSGQKAPKEVVPGLSELRTVRLRCPDAFQIGTEVTMPIAEIASRSHALDCKAVSRLTACRNLKRLEIGLGEHAEEALSSVVRKLPFLAELGLKWQRLDGGRLAQVVPNCISEIVGAAKCLHGLSLFDVRISCSELQDILKRGGTRMRELGFPTEGQDGTAMDRIESLVYTACVHNPELRSLHTTSYVKSGKWWKLRVGELDGHIRQTYRVHLALKRLKRTAPFADVESLNRWSSELQLDSLLRQCVLGW